ncbi:hypothetical protein [Nocardioides plantarum]|uniref:Uncharacterized protein n=1 Tax=Nocardioides plantarum TaxID=29299 RepID=A0ABV5K5X2_9ACTN|nr:hypothetical protein [Nocardioides plantarum]
MRWWWRVLGWIVVAMLALLIGASIGAANYYCPDDAADCDLGILWVYGGAIYGLLVAAVLALVVEMTLLARWLIRRRRPAPTGQGVST